MNIHHPPDYSSVPQDNVILEYYGINELNFDSIKKYRGEFSSINPNHPWNGLEIKEFLYKIGAWGKVRNTNQEGLTLAGLLMFSEERIITEVLPQFFLEYREILGEKIADNWSKRFTSQDGTWSGNVFDFYFKAHVELKANFNNLYQNAYFTPAEETSALFCLQEPLINALVHADYYGEGGVVIEKKPDLFQFSNPGLLRIPLEQALEGNVSNLRNPNLFKMFILIGLCKRTGSSLKSTKGLWERYGGDGSFDFIKESGLERTILRLHVKQKGISEEETREKENNLFLFSSEEELIMLNFDDKGNSYNNEHNSFSSELDSYNNMVNSFSSDNSSYSKESDSYNNEHNSFNSGFNSYNKKLNSCNSENELDDSTMSPFDDMANSYNSEDESDVHEKVDIVASHSTKDLLEEEINESSSEEMDKKLWEISELARRKKRLSPSVMEDIIVNLCSQKPLMLRELAHLLARTPDGLRNNYLAKLLDKRKIRLKYPNQPNHPKQAYIIIKK
uniref:transcriptional regulator n=1 Tax=Niallia nealsonii TaxID=115979 RepID=UPI001F2D51C8|nr:transcriptional regulator [Niallia nealsonii]